MRLNACPNADIGCGEEYYHQTLRDSNLNAQRAKKKWGEAHEQTMKHKIYDGEKKTQQFTVASVERKKNRQSTT
jgi:hypothetical protein